MRLISLAAAFTLMLGRPGPALAEDGSAALAERVEDVKRLFRQDPSDIESVLSPSFLKKVPPEKIVPVLKEYHAKGGEVVSVLKVKSLGTHAAEYRFFTKTTVFPLKLWLGETPPHLAEGLWIGVQSPRLAKPSDAVEALKALPGKVSFAAWKLGPKGPETLASLNADERLAVGSAFKLFILGVLSKDVAEGKRAWEDVASLKKEWRSWPSGVLQDWPEGAPLTLHTLASQMISISDNTATDHLLYLLGRERVEAQQETMGHAEPSRNRPFLSTREMFLLKATAQRKDRTARYAALDEKGRRAFVEELAGLPRPDSLETQREPLAIDKVEWFASASDLCRAMDWLRRSSESGPGALARGVLSINKGLTWSDARWRFVGFKGGSEPGVLNMTWLAQREDGEWFALSGGWNDAAAALDDEKLIEILQAVILSLE